MSDVGEMGGWLVWVWAPKKAHVRRQALARFSPRISSTPPTRCKPGRFAGDRVVDPPTGA